MDELLDVRVDRASAFDGDDDDLDQLVEQGRFRRDLYYRLRGLQFHIPSLRDRVEDLAPLVIEFIGRAAIEYGRSVRGVSRAALNVLTRHDWPGNVRELESEIRRAVLVCPQGGAIQPEHLGTVRWRVEKRLSGGGAAAALAGDGEPVAEPPADPVTSAAGSPGFADLQSRLDQVEREAIEQALRSSRGNRSAAARLLGITRNGLAMKMARLGITRS
ncbi:MAG TPA: helix-turn-helix domain-containing protein [Thermoanaerobaculia bacterium]|nr:helix-turn-helix domain-containing protein [Thermoanaerobaculia bacterium]